MIFKIQDVSPVMSPRLTIQLLEQRTKRWNRKKHFGRGHLRNQTYSNVTAFLVPDDSDGRLKATT